MPAATKPRRPAKVDTKVTTEETIRGLISTAFLFKQMSAGHPAIAQVWAVSDVEIATVSQPLARCLKRVPESQMRRVESMLDPVAVISSALILTVPRLWQERAIIDELRKQSARQATGTGAGAGAGAPNSDGANQAVPRPSFWGNEPASYADRNGTGTGL